MSSSGSGPARPCHALASADGTAIAVHAYGGDGPPLLLAHATGFHGMIWARFGHALARSFRVFALDFRGHGCSGRPANGDFSYVRMAEDLLAVAEDAGVGQRPFLFGHSLGGAAALMAEASAPGSFRAMFVYEAAMYDAERFAGASYDMPAIVAKRRAEFSSLDEARANFAGKAPYATFDARALDAYVEHGLVERADGSVELACRPADESDMYREYQRSSAAAAPARVRCPVVFGHGTTEDSGVIATARRAARQAPNGATAEFGGLGHFGPLTHPELVAVRVTSALLSEGFGPGTTR